jgi:EpsD family peptidyl-prolyl cis-trans isomerase
LRLKSQHLFIVAVVLAVGACSRTPKAPTGQVAATVGAHEITIRELSAELGGAPPVPPAAQKAQQQGALNLIIQRTILADVARKQGLDKDPSFVLLSKRTNDALLVQQLQAKIAASVPPPAPEEVAQFQSTNLDVFAERKIFDVEQIRMARPADPDFVKKLQPLKTLDEIASFLTQNHVGFQRGTTSIDALGQNPALVKAIVGLPPGEVFIISAGNQVLINLIHNTRTQPFTGDPAKKYATSYLRAQHTQQAVQKQLGAFIASGQRTVQIAKDYQPSKKPAGPPAVKGAAPKGG